MLKFLINVWLLGSGRKCTQAQFREDKYNAYIIVTTEGNKVLAVNSIPLSSGFWHRMRTVRTQGMNVRGGRFKGHKRSRAEVEQVMKRAETLKRAKAWDEAAARKDTNSGGPGAGKAERQ